jgi:hypothetical protein
VIAARPMPDSLRLRPARVDGVGEAVLTYFTKLFFRDPPAGAVVVEANLMPLVRRTDDD